MTTREYRLRSISYIPNGYSLRIGDSVEGTRINELTLMEDLDTGIRTVIGYDLQATWKTSITIGDGTNWLLTSDY